MDAKASRLIKTPVHFEQPAQEATLLDYLHEVEHLAGRHRAAQSREVTAQVWFKVTNDFTGVVISGFNGRDEVTYGVGLDDDGRCKFRRAGERLDPWRVLKTHLEALLFSVREGVVIALVANQIPA